MKCVILQPSYIPWRGYFHQIQKADMFVFYDDVQYEKHSWRNRNRIKTQTGTQWLTIPVLNKGIISKSVPINEILIDPKQANWNKKHLKTLQQSYQKAPFFAQYEKLLSDFYSRDDKYLADFTIDLTIALSRELGIKNTKFIRSSDISATGKKTDRLLSILQKIGATHYITGAAAQSYLEVEKFVEYGIGLEYMIYDYPEYNQLYPPFNGQVSVLDLLFMTGNEANKYIWKSDE